MDDVMLCTERLLRRATGRHPARLVVATMAAIATIGSAAGPTTPAAASPVTTTVDATTPPPRPIDQLFVEAIDSLVAERDLTARAIELGPPPPAALREQLQDADERGNHALGELRAAGFEPSDVVVATLGPLPRASDGGPPVLPAAQAYDDAIDELVAGAAAAPPGPPPTGPPPIAPSPVQAATVDTSSGDMSGLTVGLLVVAIVLLTVLVGLAVVIVTRRRKDGRLVELAMTDSLTGLSNRRRLDDDLRSFAGRSRTSVAILMVDVDNFKVFNDRHGHSTGDRILQRVGEALEREVRAKDVVYRYGGEEFCVLLPNASREEALVIAERIRLTISQLDMPVSGFVTISVGVAIGPGVDVLATLGQADAAMYDAKRDGRDRVALAGAG